MKPLHFPPLWQALAAEHPEWVLCRVILQRKGQYQLVTEDGTEQAGVVSGKFRYNAQTLSDYPAVGDYVMAEPNANGAALIHKVLHRKSVFVRKAAGTAQTEQVVAANLDKVFLCMALNLDFNLRRLERYLTVAWDSGAAPVVVLTKADLCQDLSSKLAQVEAIALGAEVLVTSALESDGYAALLTQLTPGATVAFVGSSGVGKSTLINRLMGREILATNGLRNDDKGRHTTTHRALLALPNGALVIDTPGMRELGLCDAGDGMDTAFQDIVALAQQCRFHNCSHGAEPGCAIRAALADGSLSEERWHSYQKLAAETAYAQDVGSYLASKERKFKNIAKINKANRRKKP